MRVYSPSTLFSSAVCLAVRQPLGNARVASTLNERVFPPYVIFAKPGRDSRTQIVGAGGAGGSVYVSAGLPPFH